MSELEPLATELRRELGSPPDTWVESQRLRARALQRQPPSRPARWLLATAVALSLAIAAVVLLGLTRREAPLQRWLVAEEAGQPFRLPDGSTISLAKGGRGRLTEGEDEVRFDLHGGRATFDVTPRRRQSFIVSAGKSEVHVVGTRFTVTYGLADDLEVEVEHGVVSVRVPERSSRVELEAGDRLERVPGRMALFHGKRPEDAAAPPAASSTSPALAPAPNAAPSARPEVPASRRLADLTAKELAELADQARLGGDPELAVRALHLLLERYPGSAEARNGRFLLGRVYALKGDGARAAEAFERYLATGKGLLYESEALGRLMELYSARGDQGKARAMAQRYLARAPSGPYRRLAESLAARSD